MNLRQVADGIRKRLAKLLLHRDCCATEPSLADLSRGTAMNDAVITPEILEEIRNGAQSATSKDEVLASIHQIIARVDVDPSSISLESWKQILVVAFSAARDALPA